MKIEVARIHGSEHTTDFHKPHTVEALRRLDPKLVLVRNTRLGCFQVMRQTRNPNWPEPRLVWICDWTEGLLSADNPEPLLAYLRAGDTGPNGEESERIQAEQDERKDRYDANIRRHIDQEFDHATRENMRQLARAWAPFRDFTGFVR